MESSNGNPLRGLMIALLLSLPVWVVVGMVVWQLF